MLGRLGCAARWNAAEREKNAGPVRYWVRAGNGGVTSGPFTRAGANDRAMANALEFGGTYEVVLPEYDEKGPRLYVADVVGTYTGPPVSADPVEG